VLRKIAFEDLAIEKRDLECVVSLYDGGIAYTDNAIGRLLDELRQLGIYDDTLIIITADHGEGFMEHGRVLHSQPYRELTRVPLIMKLPGSKRHARIEEMIGLIDLMPTILDIVGIEYRNLQGTSLLPVIRGDEASGRSVFTYKRKRSKEGERFDHIFLRNRDFAFYSRMFGEFELYERSVDIGEAENIAGRDEDLEERLLAETVDFYRKQGSMREKLIGEEPNAEVTRTEEEWERLRSLGYVR
jgi:arylsulfatase A-like enzyme